MKKFTLNYSLLAVFFIVINYSVFAQIGAKVQQQGKIYGLWQNSQFGYQMTLMLQENGSGEFDGDEIKFTLQGNKLSIVQSGETNAYTFVQQGNSLKLSGGDLDESITFTRNGGNQSTASAPTSNPSQQQKISTPATPTSPTDKSLIGVWSGNNETMEFKSNGQCMYGGQAFPYEVSQGHIILTTAQGKVMMAYKINGDQLAMTINGQQAVYSRGAGKEVVGQSNTGLNSGAVAMELVGKWCYVNVVTTNSGGSTADECITLNGDGTYQYYSERSMSTNMPTYWGGTSSQNGDNGTWSVQGNRIYYNSAKSGQGSYQLQKQNHPKNGDPMIVLDGKTFVTQYQKAPWR